MVSKTMEEWLLPAQLYIQNKYREAFDAVEDQLPEHTVLEPEGNKSSFTVTFPSWKERDDAHAVLANGGVRFRSGQGARALPHHRQHRLGRSGGPRSTA